MSIARPSFVVRAFATSVAGLALSAVAPAQNPITRISVDAAGMQGNGESSVLSRPALSEDGRHVAFESAASNLVANDTNGVADVFVKELATGAVVRITEDTSGREGNDASSSPSLSMDGRFVAFESLASNLVGGDTNGVSDVFLHDRDPDGNGVFDEGNGVTTRVSVRTNGNQVNGGSIAPALSGDGKWIAFVSAATNLVTGDANGFTDVFLRDVAASKTTMVSVDTSGAPAGNGHCYAPSISDDGAFIAFASEASNLIAGDGNGHRDVFLRDRKNSVTTRVSVDSSGVEGDNDSQDAAISADGKVVAFDSWATNLVALDQNSMPDVFVHEIASSSTTLVSVESSGIQGDSASFLPALDADGSVVSFTSSADNLVLNDTNHARDVFLHERASGITTCLSLNAIGVFGDDVGTDFSRLSGDGLLVTFQSHSDNLVVADTNAAADVFVRDLAVAPVFASWTNYGSGFPGTSFVPTLTASANPAFGASLTLDAANSYGAPTFGLLFIGASPASIPTNKGGVLWVDWDFILAVPFSSFGVSLPVTIPLDLSLCGVDAFLQMVEADPGAQFGFSFTPGLDLTFGL